MNRFSKMSYKFAREQNYIDLIDKLYTSNNTKRKENDPFKSLFYYKLKSKKTGELLKFVIMSMKKHKLCSPINSNILPLFQNPNYINTMIMANPQSVRNIEDKIRENPDKSYYSMTRDKSASRMISNKAQRYIYDNFQHYTTNDTEKFFNSNKGILILELSDKNIKKFIAESLNINIEKTKDLLFKINNIYYYAEIKLITQHGGSQNHQFTDSISEIDGLKTMSLIDGMMWFDDESDNKITNAIKNNNDMVISSIFLFDDILRYLNSF